MVKVGSLFTCDRCTKEYFYENNYEAMCVDENVTGWGERLGKDLCPQCLKEFDSRVDSFFRYVVREG